METQQLTRFKSISLKTNPIFREYSCDDTQGIGPLSLVNIFIGANNSGKSRLLRSLFSEKEINFTTNKYSASEVYTLINEIKPEFDRLMKDIDHIGNIRGGLLNEIANLDPEFILPSKPIYKLAEGVFDTLSKAEGGGASFRTGVPPNPNSIHPRLRTMGQKALARLKQTEFDTNIGGEKRYYIPILRGMRPLDNVQSNFYQKRTLGDYFSNSALPDNATVFTGIELYQTLKQKLLGEPEDRAAVGRFEDFLSRKFFGSRQITLIPYEGDTTVRIKIGDEPQLPIYNLGDGLQNLLICTFNIFMENARCLFFIEEPDMCMHPSLQRSLLDVMTQFPNHQYFITTHSNHLLDMTFDFSDISVFHFKKSEDGPAHFQIRATTTGDRQVLRDLGVRNSSVFLSNASIWVEGITDRLYLRAYLRKYCDEIKAHDPDRATALSNLKEDQHYSFVEYQGSNLEHWTFDSKEDTDRIKAMYVSAHALVIADGDVASKGDREVTYKQMLGDQFIVLDVKEIENLIPAEILKEVVRKKFERHNKDVETIRYENYAKDGVAIGSYLDGILGVPSGKSEFAEDSGTLKSKTRFCERVVESMNDTKVNWNLTPHLKDLCKRIFDHIQRENNG